MRWNYLVAFISCALLAVFRLSDGGTALAAVFGVLALGFLYLALRPLLPAPLGSRASEQLVESAARREPEGKLPPTAGQPDVEAVRDVVEKRTKGWLGIIAFGCVLTILGFFLFPPMSLLVASMTVYALTRYRKYRRMVNQMAGPADDSAPRRSER